MPAGTQEDQDPAEPRTWTDRLGGTHTERRTELSGRDRAIPRVVGPLETAWAHTVDEDPGRGDRDRAVLAAEALARPDPLVDDDPADPHLCLYTWTVEAARASTVLLWANALFDHRDVAASEFTRLDGSDLWTLTLRLPRSWRASYRIAVWEHDGPPPWRRVQGRREVRLAALDAGAPDPRGSEVIEPRAGTAASVAGGPDAPPDPWPRAAREAREAAARATGTRGTGAQQVGARGAAATGSAHGPRAEGRVRVIDFPGARTYGPQRAWVYSPPCAGGAAGAGPRRQDRDQDPEPALDPDRRSTPLLVLFDGQVWARGLDLPALLDAAIGAGAIRPVHVAMVDSHDEACRWDELGVPTGQVDFVLDALLPRLRAELPVDRTGAGTLVAGQSFGGLASLWTLALGRGEVGRAIAQSPSLWRFDLAEPLLRAPGWSGIRISSGSFEGTMLDDAHRLAESLQADPRLDGRGVDVRGVQGGHDWAWWRQDLLAALAELLPGPGGN